MRHPLDQRPRAQRVGYFRATQPEHLLKPPTRQRVLDRLRAEGPATAGGLARALACRDARVRYHLRILLDAGVVRALKEGPVTIYYAAGSEPADRVRAAVVLGRPQGRAVVEVLRPGPASSREVGERLGISRATALRRLRRLEAAGLVERRHRGWALVPEGRVAAGPPPPGASARTSDRGAAIPSG